MHDEIAKLRIQVSSLSRGAHDKDLIIQALNFITRREREMVHKTVARMHKLQLQVKKLEDLKDSLTHMIVHDLNNPLAAVSGNLQLLQLLCNEKLSKDESDCLKQAFDSSEELKMMIANLLDINKMEEGELKLNYENFRLQELVREVVRQMQISASRQSKSVSLEADCEIPGISADKVLIKRVIANLISNAIKYTPENGSVIVKVDCRNENSDLYIEVRDSGPGIANEYREKIFEKFAQVQDSRARLGHGLGLTFCKLAVEAHGGKIWVESEVGKGSTFCFTIPAKKP
jgi:signal transduction histidine kinase